MLPILSLWNFWDYDPSLISFLSLSGLMWFRRKGSTISDKVSMAAEIGQCRVAGFVELFANTIRNDFQKTVSILCGVDSVKSFLVFECGLKWLKLGQHVRTGSNTSVIIGFTTCLVKPNYSFEHRPMNWIAQSLSLLQCSIPTVALHNVSIDQNNRPNGWSVIWRDNDRSVISWDDFLFQRKHHGNEKLYVWRTDEYGNKTIMDEFKLCEEE